MHMRNEKCAMKKITYIIIFCFLNYYAAAWAQSFVVKRILKWKDCNASHLQQLKVICQLSAGQTLQPRKQPLFCSALYKTGFFDHITLSREGNTLIIHVVERPTIGQFKITGNSVIPTDKLTTVMKSLDIAEGRVYNRCDA